MFSFWFVKHNRFKFGKKSACLSQNLKKKVRADLKV